MKVLIAIFLAMAAIAMPQEKFGNAFDGIKGYRNRLIGSGMKPNIVGGQEAVPHAFPYQVSFQYKYGGIWYHNCGGSIVEADKIITAAHCIYGAEDLEFRIVAGEHDLMKNDGTEQVIAVAKAIYHPQFSFSTGDFDYAVLRHGGNLTFNKNVAPIPLPISTDFVPSGNCMNTGWGNLRSDDGEEYPDKLQEVTLPVVDHEACVKKYAEFVFHVTDHMFCAGDVGKGSCSHDSGGPLVCNGVLAGIISWTRKPCTQDQYPTVFADVAKALDWFAAQ